MNQKLLFIIFFSLSYHLIAQHKPYNKEHDLFLMPTAFTMDKGQAYLTHYQLFFLNVTYSITQKTHFGVFSLFPVTGDYTNTFTLGFKQNILEKKYIGIATFSSYMPKKSYLAMGGIISVLIGNYAGIHAGLGGLRGNRDLPSGRLFLLGMKIEMNNRMAFIVEYSNIPLMDESYEGEHEELFDLNHYVTFGCRMRGKRLALDIGAIKPRLDVPELGIWVLPYLKGTVYFGR
ncbi:MAG: hypothetical protein Kow00108_08300 [Calditrichia bacterium]